MKIDGTAAGGIIERLRIVLGHLGRGFSFIVAPHGTGTTVTFNLPGRLVTLLAILLVLFVAGVAFVGVTYTKLAFLAFETERLRAENEDLRLRCSAIDRIENEILHIDHVRREIEAWAGVIPRDSVTAAATPAVLMPRTWPRRYTYALLGAHYRLSGLRSHGMIQPAAGWVSRSFIKAETGGPGHPGIDIAAPTGTPVRSTLGGVVKAAGWDEVYGNLIEIEHNDSLTTVYGHNERILVKEGEYVKRGQVIATVGNTGRSTAPHLHFEILEHNEPRNPEDYVVFESK